ncbi:hypothetical protein LEP3755_30540 [Leptolyngbya sp. NIES-3755]|nr:hypothetical protein LEP3755_30540 [Leptolyngbya sp. NIES-3755]
MPSQKQRVSVTITDQLQKTLNTLWRNYPDLEGHVLESIQFLMIYGSEAIERDRKGLPTQEDNQTTGDITPLLKNPPEEPKFVSPADEWA